MSQLANLRILKDFELPSELFSLGSLSSQDQKQVFPLASVKIHSQVLENLADIEILQRFHNPYDHVIEAVYTFPMPGSAAVYDFEIQLAERRIKGEVQERAAARHAYQQALESGYHAALLEQDRDDVFSLQVGNIAAGESIQIKLKLCQVLDFRDQGLYELRLPTVIAPRYIPGKAITATPASGHGSETDTDLVPDASRISPPRLAPGSDAQLDFELKIELLLSPGQSLIQIQSSQHLIETSFSAGKISLELSQARERLNRDFVLRWRVQSESLNSESKAVQAQLYWSDHKDPNNIDQNNKDKMGIGLLHLKAPMTPAQLSTQRDLIFLVDRSGSMGDFNMASASRACSMLLDSLSPQDRFAILAFDDQMEWLKSETIWFNANEDGRAKGRQFLNKLQSRGGTELFMAIEDSLQQIKKRPIGSENLPILVILTDGQVGDESRILKTIQKQLGEALVYTIGIDVAVNDSFLGRLARLGGGTSVCVSPGEKLDQALQNIASEIGYPALQSISLNLPAFTPDPIPDLYQGRSQSILFKGPHTDKLKLSAQNQLSQTDWQFDLQTQVIEFPCLAQAWAKSRIRDLEDQYRMANSQQQSALKEQMITLSVNYQILCRFTAWIAVDDSESVKESSKRVQIIQPVEDPQVLDFAQFTGALPPPPPICPSPMMAPAGFSRSLAVPSPQKKSMKAKVLNQIQGFFSDTANAPHQGTDNESDTIMSAAIADFETHFHLILNQLKQADFSQQSKDQLSLLESLKQARALILDALSESEIAERLPALQSLLRKDSLRLIKALERMFTSVSSVHPDDIQQLVILCEAQFQRFVDEFESEKLNYNLKLRMI